MQYSYENKTILVTGGVGSIGSTLVTQLLKNNPKSVRVLDIDENRLFEFGQHNNIDKIRTFIGDIRDKERLNRAVKGADVVFHAAALKHVPLCEYNPFEAIKTNVIGTQNMIEVAIDENVDKFITISTDKAVNPINVMGATKLLAERLTISANLYKGKSETAFSCCRFGNVINSRGSVVPIFVDQILNQKKVTITDKSMTRFMMTINNAIDLVLQVGKISKGGEIYILKMPSVKISDLAESIVEIISNRYKLNTNDIKIEYIGKRPGEKLYEKLITPNEYINCYESEQMYLILPEYEKTYKEFVNIPSGFKKINKEPLSSNENESINKDEIAKLLNDAGI